MSSDAHKTLQVLVASIAAVVVVYFLFGKKDVVAPPQTVIQKEWMPLSHDTVIIHNNTVVYPAASSSISQTPGITTAQLDSMLREYFAKVTYDTTFSDSTSRESLSIEIERNRIKRLIRSLSVTQTTKTVTIQAPSRNALYGGLFTMPVSGHQSFGPVLSYLDNRGFILSAGKDITSSSIYGSFQIRFGR